MKTIANVVEVVVWLVASLALCGIFLVEWVMLGSRENSAIHEAAIAALAAAQLVFVYAMARAVCFVVRAVAPMVERISREADKDE